MSDGTAELRFLDPATLLETHRLPVTANGNPVTQLNELEWVDGEILANVWQTDRIARIDPATGRVVGWIDLTGILPAGERIPNHTDVLNGIAYDAAGKRLFVNRQAVAEGLRDPIDQTGQGGSRRSSSGSAKRRAAEVALARRLPRPRGYLADEQRLKLCL